MKQIPMPLFRKILFTGLIGTACMIFGIVNFAVSRDRILLLLSAAVLVGSLQQAYSIVRVVRQGQYELVEGTCVGVKSKLAGRFKTVRFMDDDGLETALRLSKNIKLVIGSRYRLYFIKRNQAHTTTGSTYFDSMLAADNFLGFEEIAADDETSSNGEESA